MTTVPSIDANNNNILGDVGTRSANGTSFAAPLTAGTAALLEQYGIAQGLSHDHQDKKALLMNSASKHILSRDPDGGGLLTGTAWPVRYAARNLNPLAIGQSLDPQAGTGMLNGLAAVRQYQPGFRSDVALQGSTLAGGGSNTSNLFVGGEKLKPGSPVTATLVWDRVVTNTLAGANPLLNIANYASSAPPDLNLELVNRGSGAVVARANSAVDNGEHLYFNVPAEADEV